MTKGYTPCSSTAMHVKWNAQLIWIQTPHHIRRNTISSMTFFRCTPTHAEMKRSQNNFVSTKMNCGEATCNTLDSTDSGALEIKVAARISPEFRPSRCHRHQSLLDIKICRIKFETKMSASAPKLPAHHIHNRQCRQMVFDEIRTRPVFATLYGEQVNGRAERVCYMRPRSQITHSKWNRCTAAAAQQFIFYSMVMRW